MLMTMRMMRSRNHTGRPRRGTGWSRKDVLFRTAMSRVSGWIGPVVGPTTIVYEPSGALPGTLIVPRKKPSGLWDVVRFVATVEPPERSSIVSGTPTMPTELSSRTYPVTLSALPGWTAWPGDGVRIATNPFGGVWTFKVMFTKLLLS